MGVSLQKVAVACGDTLGLKGRVSARFAKCPSYVIAELSKDEIVSHRVLTNPYFHNHTPGALTRFLDSLDVDAVLTGGMGARAAWIFDRFGIDVCVGYDGSVEKCLKEYLAGKRPERVLCDRHDHGRQGQDPR